MARRSFAGISVFGAIGLVRIGMAAAQAASAVSIDPATRTVTTSNFTVTWNTGADTEAITSLSWKGGANLTGSYGINACGFGGDGDVEYFGNSQAPPDPQAGGKVLVGGGTVTPEGTVPWSAQILPAGTAQIAINSSSANCPPSSAGIDVQTTYRFFDSDNPAVNWVGVQRVFNFAGAPFSFDFRPYIARLSPRSSYTVVLYPTPAGELAAVPAANCGEGLHRSRLGPRYGRVESAVGFHARLVCGARPKHQARRGGAAAGIVRSPGRCNRGATLDR